MTTVSALLLKEASVRALFRGLLAFCCSSRLLPEESDSESESVSDSDEDTDRDASESSSLSLVDERRLLLLEEDRKSVV